ncbi:guanylate kinase [Phaeocystidibacter luteus]|uniref:Guanylate kinase n=1 Tax=Phaeocystidibacter luteus TaxID=911197 RepID=A0A6N6REK3_9FLAO|nr:guanylate kinase [Phaeocystidibacter luteus]KAB2808627.1 guanylate kinase [Phaeocystidibacter luteus]
MFSRGKLVILSAPSGSGKTTIIRHLLEVYPELEFSISATSRAPRGKEQHGVDYYFLSADEFRKRIENGEFLEWEEVYEGTYYGTLRSEVSRIWDKGGHVAFDIDVVGGLNLKKHFEKRALAVYVRVPTMEELEKRLRGRGTDSEEKIQQRLAKAEEEGKRESEFDITIVNDELERACREAEEKIGAFLKS